MVLMTSFTNTTESKLLLLPQYFLAIFADPDQSKNSFRRNSVTNGTLCHAIGLFVFYYHHVTYRTPCYASGHLVIYHECYGSERERLLLSGVF